MAAGICDSVTSDARLGTRVLTLGIGAALAGASRRCLACIALLFLVPGLHST